jgi:CheY-like chemotaxis protein
MRAAQGSGIILVADDEPVVQQAAKRALERYGYKVLIASDGKQVIELFRSRAAEIDLILLDMAMPVMTGEEALPELKYIHPDVPVVISSGYSEQMARERFGSEAVEAFLQKPYTGHELMQKIQSVLGREARQ